MHRLETLRALEQAVIRRAVYLFGQIYCCKNDNCEESDCQMSHLVRAMNRARRRAAKKAKKR